jgi:hypothetical protein
MNNEWQNSPGMHNPDPNNQGQGGGEPHGGSQQPYGGQQQGYGGNQPHGQTPYGQAPGYGGQTPYGQDEPAYGGNSPYSQGYGGTDPNAGMHGASQPYSPEQVQPIYQNQGSTPAEDLPQATPATTAKGCGLAGCIVAAILFFCLFVVILIVNSNSPRVIYLNSITVEPAKIAEKNDEDGRYIRLEVPRLDAPQEVMWTQVDNAFYDKHRVGDEVGVLLGNYDVYKPGREFWLFGNKTRKFEKTSWGIENVYDNLDLAKKANPQEKFEVDATVKDKQVEKSGLKYMLLDAKGKVVKAVVTDDVFNSTNTGQTLKCEFESTGDYVRFLGVKTTTP